MYKFFIANVHTQFLAKVLLDEVVFQVSDLTHGQHSLEGFK